MKVESMNTTRNHKILGLSLVLFQLLAGNVPVSAGAPRSAAREFSFIVTADMRNFAGAKYQKPEYFLGTCQAIREVGQGAFMVSPGDLDPPGEVAATIEKVLGKDYPWYPVVGNHEAETRQDMEWLREWGRRLPYLVRRGPRHGELTTYSFDYGEAHFVVLNLYYNGKSDAHGSGEISEALYKWLEKDLHDTTQPFIFVFGHEPIVSLPDYHSGRIRHVGDNLDAHPESTQRFLQLLRRYRVVAYICGHTHNFSYAKISGIWQLDAGHARGAGDKGSRSTFLKILVGKPFCRVEVYRDDANGGPYNLTNTIILD